MSFSFEKAEIQQGNVSDPNKPRVMKPGIYEVVTTNLTSGKIDNENQTPYIDWTVTNSEKEILTHRYYIGTTVKEGKKMSAWDITSSDFLQLVSAICSLDKETSRTKLTEVGSSSTSDEQFTAKLSALVVGKPFMLKVNGEEVVSTNATSGKFTKSKFGNYTFALSTKSTPSELSRMGKIYIKLLPAATSTPVGTPVNGLPF